MLTPNTFAEVLRLWSKAADLGDALRRHGCEASDVLIRRWWNDEMLPPRAHRALVAAAADAGHPEVTLDVLAQIAETPRSERLAIVKARAAA